MATDKADKQKAKKKDPAASASGAKKKGRGKKGSSPEDAGIRIAAKGENRVAPESGMPRLQKKYREEIAGELKKSLSLKSVMEVPRLEKIVVNCAMKDAVGNPKILDNAMNDLMLITGQKPVLTRARKAIASFKLRKGVPLGTRVTLRRARMYEFLDRLISFTLPRVRDFKGISPKSFDGRGNYSLGLKEQIIFPEINYDKVDQIRGMTVTIATTAKNNEQARQLLAAFGMPFRK